MDNYHRIGQEHQCLKEPKKEESIATENQQQLLEACMPASELKAGERTCRTGDSSAIW
jgi:hypothetical protein